MMLGSTNSVRFVTHDAYETRTIGSRPALVRVPLFLVDRPIVPENIEIEVLRPSCRNPRDPFPSSRFLLWGFPSSASAQPSSINPYVTQRVRPYSSASVCQFICCSAPASDTGHRGQPRGDVAAQLHHLGGEASLAYKRAKEAMERVLGSDDSLVRTYKIY
jgi:hypothetical protein